MNPLDSSITQSNSTDVADPKFGLSRRSFLRGVTYAAVPIVASSIAGCSGASAAEWDPNAPTPTPDLVPSTATISTDPYKVAMIGKLASKTYQINEAVDNFIGYMREAKAAGAALVTAGEVYLPGYPNDINYTSDWATKGWPAYKRNSITVGDSNWLRLLDAARLIGIAIQFGFSEKSGNLYYMSQALIGPDGSVWNQRRKLRPSGSERNFWSDDVMKNNLRVVTTPLGRISMLMCWDHLRPQSTFDVMAQLPNVHICAWPITAETTASTPGWDRQEVAQTAASYFSQLTGAVTLLVSYGYCAVYRSSIKVAEMLPSDPANMLYYTITPRDWSGSAGNTDSEFSYGVLQLLSDNYPGQKVADPARNVLTLNPQTT